MALLDRVARYAVSAKQYDCSQNFIFGVTVRATHRIRVSLKIVHPFARSAVRRPAISG
jgi:hypothetical protein